MFRRDVQLFFLLCRCSILECTFVLLFASGASRLAQELKRLQQRLAQERKFKSDAHSKISNIRSELQIDESELLPSQWMRVRTMGSDCRAHEGGLCFLRISFAHDFLCVCVSHTLCVYV